MAEEKRQQQIKEEEEKRKANAERKKQAEAKKSKEREKKLLKSERQKLETFCEVFNGFALHELLIDLKNANFYNLKSINNMYLGMVCSLPTNFFPLSRPDYSTVSLLLHLDGVHDSRMMDMKSINMKESSVLRWCIGTSYMPLIDIIVVNFFFLFVDLHSHSCLY